MGYEYFEKEHCDCTKCTDNKVINAEENKRVFSVQNKSRKLVCKIEIDGCVIKKGIKCDYLFVIPLDEKAFFVELKGQDLLKAIKQLDSSITMLSSHLEKHEINARVVLTKANTPDLRSSELIKFKKRIKKLGGNLKYGTRKMVESV